MSSRSARALLSVLTGAGLMFAGPAAVPAFASTAPAATAATAATVADACYTWSGALSEGASGEAVRQLQIRVAGYPGSGNQLAIDGQFGPGTKAAVQRFQSAYGLGAD
ncbi:MAG TPA: peptidoglycan-binding domain-containing protein, partial [Streptomyces sp.]|nr:peptidoglycan-binding domain-containing protein [Streptomyces sp.]